MRLICHVTFSARTAAFLHPERRLTYSPPTHPLRVWAPHQFSDVPRRPSWRASGRRCALFGAPCSWSEGEGPVSTRLGPGRTFGPGEPSQRRSRWNRALPSVATPLSNPQWSRPSPDGAIGQYGQSNL